MTYHKAVFWRHKAPTQDIHWNRNGLASSTILRAIRLVSPTRPPVSCTRSLDLLKQP
jgi:hypothetical protein